MNNQNSNFQSSNEFEVNKNNENKIEQKIKSVKFKSILDKFEKKSTENSSKNENFSNNDENVNSNEQIPKIKRNYTQNYDIKAKEENEIKTVKTKNDKLLKAKRKILMMNELNKKISVSKEITGKAKELEKKITNDFDKNNNKNNIKKNSKGKKGISSSKNSKKKYFIKKGKYKDN